MPDTSPNENTPLETTGRTIARITPAKVPAGTAGTGHGEDRDPGSRKNSAIEDPRSIIRQGLVVILLFFGVLGAWAYWGEISGAVVAPGKIKVESERKTVQHLEGGIVDTILVREGQDVAEGQVLVELESVQVDASENMLQKQLVAQWAAHSRALAEKSFSDELVWPDGLVELARTVNSADVLDNEQKIFQARKEALRGQLSLLETQIAQLQASHMGERGRLRQAIAETKQRDAELRLRMEDLRNRFVEEATSEAGKLENDIIQTRERIRPLRDAKKRLQVKAPVSGKVVDLKVHSRGGVVRPGEPLMDIVPHDTPLIVETHVPINKITEVYIGQDALVQLDAFDTRIVPHIPAKVTYISADRLEDKTAAGTTPYYLCYVVIDPQALKDAKLYLRPECPPRCSSPPGSARCFITCSSPCSKAGIAPCGSDGTCAASRGPASGSASAPAGPLRCPPPAGRPAPCLPCAGARCSRPFLRRQPRRPPSSPPCRPGRSTGWGIRSMTCAIRRASACWTGTFLNFPRTSRFPGSPGCGARPQAAGCRCGRGACCTCTMPTACRACSVWDAARHCTRTCP